MIEEVDYNGLDPFCLDINCFVYFRLVGMARSTMGRLTVVTDAVLAMKDWSNRSQHDGLL